MNRLLSTFLLLFAVGIAAYGQYGFGTNAPNPSAVVDMTSTNKGVLIPQVALESTTASGPVSGPEYSLLVYNIASKADVTPGFYFWSGVAWVRLLEDKFKTTFWKMTGNAGTTASANYLGTNDFVDLVIKTAGQERMRVTAAGNVGVGTSSPNVSALLDLSSGNKGLLLPSTTKDNLKTNASTSLAGMITYNSDAKLLN